MPGMDKTTGRPIEGTAHLAQSIAGILSTPIGSRVMRRDYGSDLPGLIDAPMTPALLSDVYQAVAEALDRWEPRFTLTRVEVLSAVPGKMEISVIGEVDGALIDLPVSIGGAE